MKAIWTGNAEATALAKRKVIRTSVVLDVGPGIRPQAYFRPRIHICLEPHLPYIERMRQGMGDDPTYVFLNSTWDVAMRLLPAKSVDTVFALDVIEHFEKQEGLKFLEEAERVARRQIMVFTPLGFYPQTFGDSDKSDRWGMDGACWQTHRSGWYPEDFGEGWELICCEACHFVDQHELPLDKPFGGIWAFRNLEIKEDQTLARRWNRTRARLTLRSRRFLGRVLRRLKLRR
jgi:hypothetical protein